MATSKEVSEKNKSMPSRENIMVCANIKGPNQPAQMRRLIWAFDFRLKIKERVKRVEREI